MAFRNNYSGVAVGGAGLFSAGDYFDGTHLTVIHKRSTVDGSILWTAYASDIAMPNNPEYNSTRLALDGTNLYMGGYDSDLSPNGIRVQRRALLDGAILKNETFQPGNNENFLTGLAANSTGLFLSAYRENVTPSSFGWYIARLDKILLSVTWSRSYTFSGSGDESDACSTDIAVDENYVYAIGFETDSGTGDLVWRIEKLSADTGALLQSRNYSSGSGDDRGFGIAAYGDAVFAIGESGSDGLIIKKLKASDLTDYGGSWSDHIIVETALETQIITPAKIAAGSTGAYAICEGRQSPSNVSTFHFTKVDLDTGDPIWNNDNGLSGISNGKFPQMIKLYGNAVYYCGNGGTGLSTGIVGKKKA